MAAFKLRREYAVFRGGVLLCAIGAALLPRAAEAQWGSPHSALRGDHRVHQAINVLRQKGWTFDETAGPPKLEPRTRAELAVTARLMLKETDGRAVASTASVGGMVARVGPSPTGIPVPFPPAELEELHKTGVQWMETLSLVREVVLELRAELTACGVDTRRALLMLDAVQRRWERIEPAVLSLESRSAWRRRVTELLRRAEINKPYEPDLNTGNR